MSVISVSFTVYLYKYPVLEVFTVFYTVKAPVIAGVILNTVNSRLLEVVGPIFYKFKLPEVQINL